MSGTKGRLIIASVTIIFLALIGLQVFWLQYSFTLEEALFNKSVKIALNQSVASFCKNESVCKSIEKAMSCDSSFHSEKKSPRVLWKELDKQLKNELANYDIDLAFELAVFKGKDTLLLSKANGFHDVSCYKTNLDRTLKLTDTEIGLIFPNRFHFFMHQMGWMFMGSVLMIVLLILGFFQITHYYLKELRLSRNIKEMVNNLAHEFKTPITSISLAAKMMQQEEIVASNPRLQQFARTIMEENKRLMNHSDQILQLAAIERNSLDYNFCHTDLTTVAQEAANTVEFLIRQAGGELIKDVPEKPILIFGDKNILIHAVTNLLVNALKYSEKEIRIAIALKETPGGADLSITDHGMGIPASEIKNIFDKYYRIPKGNQHNTKGFGIGLYYVREVLRVHGATIQVHSEVGKGSCFTISFKKERT
ncbi:MAG: HAMP domain-containing histidine kinase [Marinilabiliales bacterium]|nr:HAMP domain-containing histidine kinase [Marinilabiliales bacterium]